jgi:plasmid maintenance system antidote protein VapI
MAEKKPVSPEVAVRIGKLFGGGPGIQVRMQAAHDTWHDTWHAERNVDVSGIPTLKVA